MFLKEILSIFGASSTILGLSGLALKIKKFEHNQLIHNQLFLSLNSYKKLNIKLGGDFYYFDEEENEKVLRISKIENVELDTKNDLHASFMKLTFLNLSNSLTPKNSLIKYYLEAKTLWTNLIG